MKHRIWMGVLVLLVLLASCSATPGWVKTDDGVTHRCHNLWVSEEWGGEGVNCDDAFYYREHAVGYGT